MHTSVLKSKEKQPMILGEKKTIDSEFLKCSYAFNVTTEVDLFGFFESGNIPAYVEGTWCAPSHFLIYDRRYVYNSQKIKRTINKYYQIR